MTKTKPKAGLPVPAANVTSSPIPMFNIGVPEKKTKTSEYPIVPDPTGELARIGARIRINKELVETAKGGFEADRGRLLEICLPFYFERCHGLAEAPSSVVVDTPEGEVRLTFPDKYKSVADPALVVKLVGPAIAAAHFHQSWELKIDGDELPATPKTQELLNKVVDLFKEYGAEGALKLKSGIKPKKGFALVRHTVLSVDQNLALNEVVPVVATCNTKGRE